MVDKTPKATSIPYPTDLMQLIMSFMIKNSFQVAKGSIDGSYGILTFSEISVLGAEVSLIVLINSRMLRFILCNSFSIPLKVSSFIYNNLPEDYSYFLLFIRPFLGLSDNYIRLVVSSVPSYFSYDSCMHQDLCYIQESLPCSF